MIDKHTENLKVVLSAWENFQNGKPLDPEKLKQLVSDDDFTEALTAAIEALSQADKGDCKCAGNIAAQFSNWMQCEYCPRCGQPIKGVNDE